MFINNDVNNLIIDDVKLNYVIVVVNFWKSWKCNEVFFLEYRIKIWDDCLIGVGSIVRIMFWFV